LTREKSPGGNCGSEGLSDEARLLLPLLGALLGGRPPPAEGADVDGDAAWHTVASRV
jgi:hypothetical protein